MNAVQRTPVALVLRLCLHALLAGLLALPAVRAVADGAPRGGAVVGAVLAMGAVYAAGTLSPAVARSRRAAAVWLAALGVCWVVLLALSPDGLWAAFPLYFLQLHLLPVRWALPAVALTAAAAIMRLSAAQLARFSRLAGHLHRAAARRRRRGRHRPRVPGAVPGERAPPRADRRADGDAGRTRRRRAHRGHPRRA